MQLTKFTIGAALAIATVAGAQSTALSQSTFKNPTHPTLAEVTAPASATTASMQAQLTTPRRQAMPGAMSNGQTTFSNPPRLIRSASSQLAASTPSTYEFTITVPADAGQPLKAVTIAQATNIETVQFDVGQTQAFAGERFAAGPEIPLASVGGEQPENPGEVTVVFDKPVQPGSTVTVAIAAKENPSLGGVYEFGVTAYPIGESSRGQFLGYGRINLYGNSN